MPARAVSPYRRAARGWGVTALAAVLGGCWLAASYLVLEGLAGESSLRDLASWMFLVVSVLLLASLLVHQLDRRRDIERLLRHTADVLRSIELVSDGDLAQLPLDAFLAELLARVRRALDVDVALIALVTDGGDHLVVRAAEGLGELNGEPFPMPDGLGRAETGGAASEPRLTNDARRVELLHPELRGRVASLLDCPLAVDGRVTGVLEVGSLRARRFGDEDVRLLQMVADRASVAIERARLHEAERRSRLGNEHARRHLALLAEASKVLAPSLDAYEPALAALVDIAVPAFADWCAVDLVDTTGAIGRLAWRHGDPATAARAGAALAGHPDWPAAVARAMARGLPEMVFDVRADDAADGPDAAAHRSLAADLGLVSCMTVPIRVRGLSLGAITFATGGNRRGYRDSDLAAAGDLAQRAGVAIERVLLYRETREAARRFEQHAAQLRRLMEASLAVNAPLTRNEVVRVVADQARRLIGARASRVTSAGAGETPVEAVSPPGVPDADRRPEDRPPGSWLAAPLTASGGGQQGNILLVDKQEGPFSPDDESLLVSFAQMASVALENARLYQTMVASEERLRALVDSAPLAILELDLDGTVRRWNPAAGSTFGWSTSRAGVGPSFVDDSGQIAELAREAAAGNVSLDVELTLRRGDGTPANVSVSTAPLWDAGLVHGVLVVLADITERRRLEDQLHRAQRMEAMGTLAGGVAHDFNNLLTVILGHSELVLRKLPDTSPVRPDLEAVRRAGERAARITAQLLTISHHQAAEPVVLDPSAVVASTGDVLRHLIGSDIALRIVAPPGLGAIEADPGQLEQVILNLAINARDAMPHGGRLLIETSRAGDTHIGLRVADTGVGMDAHALEHCFEPFFTTKERSKGTGLGLATVYGIVTKSGGDIEVTSEPGRGTAFLARFPRTTRLPRADAPFVDRPAPPGVERVLLVEDEDAVRTLAREILESGGYTVVEAANGPEALTALSRGRALPDLLITDVVMPGMSGPELARRLRRSHPLLPVLFISGYAEGERASWSGNGRSSHFLAKPFQPEELRRRVREVLDGVTAPSAEAQGSKR